MQLKYLENSFNKLDKSWQDIFNHHFASELVTIDQKLSLISQDNTVYPPAEKTFNAFNYTPFKEIKVVILGQDPYHGEGEANGLAFAVESDNKLPPSLRNIFKQIKSEYQVDSATSGKVLYNWAKQGALLLNSSLTVIKDKPNSLANIGWHSVTDQIISYISNNLSNIVFILWGEYAKKKMSLINSEQNLVLTAAHPSPFSVHRGFFGCNHFSKTNEFLQAKNIKPITWL